MAPAKPHESHQWAEDKPQTRCVKCGAYKHLSSGFLACRALDPAAAPAETFQLDTTPRPNPPSPIAMIQAAIEHKMDPAGLEKLTDLAERWRDMDARQQFNGAMTACQGEMPSIVNDSQNPSTQSRYPKFETLLRAAKPVWTRHGFALSFGTADCPREGYFRVVCDVRHKGGHVERYQADIGIDGIGPQGNPIGKMNKPQASGSTFAYGQRYLTKLIFCLAFADEDDDAVQARTQCITSEQIGELNDLIEKCREAGKPVNFEGFLKWLAVENMGDLKQVDFPKARKELQRKLSGDKKS